jgi:hypothetical protein
MSTHQDDFYGAPLDRWARLNINMDSLAKAYWVEQFDQPANSNSILTGEHWPIFFNRQKIHLHLYDTLYEEIYREKCQFIGINGDERLRSGVCW